MPGRHPDVGTHVSGEESPEEEASTPQGEQTPSKRVRNVPALHPEPEPSTSRAWGRQKGFILSRSRVDPP